MILEFNILLNNIIGIAVVINMTYEPFTVWKVWKYEAYNYQ